ncbi:MAG: PD-(D/E)XK nuclease family protein [Verrucomicrobiota bacterium]|nr:PD-(D/E)XK nuclease family protein [Verrucomicrobiota bacterium]
MRACFLLGPAGSGKTFRCLAEVRAALQENPEGAPLIFLAPKQATFQLERQLLADPSLNGYARLQIVSFDRLARGLLDELRVAPPPCLSDEGRVMVLRALLMRHQDELKLFSRSARRPGFARQLGQLLAELRRHHLTPARLRALARDKGLPAELRDKLNDLALLDEHYSRWLAEHQLQDGNCLLDLAADRLLKGGTTARCQLSFEALWLDGFAEMTPQELDLLSAVLPFCKTATLAFCLDESDADKMEDTKPAQWSVVSKTLQQCRQRIARLPDCKIELETLPRDPRKTRFARNPELAWLEKSWFQAVSSDRPATSISVTACAQPEAEAVFAAREVLKFVRAGNRFRDCGVMVRDLENYHRPLARVFRRYQIPFFLDRREGVAHHPLAELTRSALRTAAFDWRHDDWFAALKAGFSPAGESEMDGLENAALEFGWRGKKWREPVQIVGDPDRAQSLEKLRRRILPPFERFHDQLARLKFQPAGPELAGAVRHLWEDLKVAQQIQKWTAQTPAASSPRRFHAPHNLHATVLEQMNAWLENLALAFPREALSLRDWQPILEAGLATLTVGVIPPALDEVLIGAVDRARNPDLKLALVLGLNETLFPAAPRPPPILTAADRDGLRGAVLLGPDLRERLAREWYYGYIACAHPGERLVLTFSRRGADGAMLNPSPFIGHLRRIFPSLPVGEFSGEPDWRQAEHVNELVEPLVKLNAASPCGPPAETGDNQDGAHPRHWRELLGLPALPDLARNLARLREPDPGEHLPPETALKIYGPVLRTAVSRLEEFAQCPFKFFVRSGLRAKERKLFELDARERGSFQHEVLKMFHEQLAAEGRHWRDLTPPEARDRIAAIAAALQEDYRGGLLRDSAQTRFEARALAGALQDFVEVLVSWMRAQYEFDPAAAELDFGFEGSPAPAWELDLGDGRRLALRGRIDRIDLWRAPGGEEALAVVMDYKSGGRTLDEILVAHGVQLQLPAYLDALRHWGKPRGLLGVGRLVPAGVFYVNLRGQYATGRTRDEVLGAGNARRLAYRHTGRFNARVLDKLDRIGTADQFNYRLNQDGSLRQGQTEALPPDEFEQWLDRVEARLRDMGRRIFSGAASVDPYRKGRETPCEFCDYRAVCRIDPWTHHWRVLTATKKPAA